MRAIMFIPVGTSLITNNMSSTPADVSTAVDRIIDKNLSKRPISVYFGLRPNKKDLSPAELSGLYQFCQEEKAIAEGSLELFLLHSPKDGKCCAQGIERLIRNKSYFMHDISSWNICLTELCGLDPNNSSLFNGAMDIMVEAVLTRVQDFDGEVYVNLSGGYKAIGPYLTMVAMALGPRVRVFYIFENSKELVWLPSYPMAFDMLEWRDHRGLLRPFSKDIGLTDDQKKGFRSALNGTRMADLIEPEVPYRLNAIGRTMDRIYSGDAGRRLTEFGLGHALLNLLKEKSRNWAIYLETECIPRWRHLSVGDRIPETAEHGRGHVQRLLELTQQLIVAACLELSKEQLFTLICSIWLHDLGHSGDCFRFEGKDGIIQKKDCPDSKETEFVMENPELVRQYHHLLTYEILKTHRDFLFPVQTRGIYSLNRDDLPFRSVELACLYHRGRMPVNDAAPYDDKVYVSKGLASIDASNGAIVGFPVVAALLRFLDGTENQEERTGSEEYYKVAKWVLSRQIESMKTYLKDHPSEKQLEVRIDFKEIQGGHYEKHRWVKSAFFVPAGILPGDIEYYGRANQNGNESPIVALYLIANTGADGFAEHKFNEEITAAVINEFELVLDLMPFRLVLFRVLESKKDTGTVLQYWADATLQWQQLVATPDVPVSHS